MEITHEHKLLIENLIRANSRFSGNEDLIEDFCSETLKRSYKIISSINNINHLEGYLNKVATSAILEVLKNSGRLRRSSGGYVKTPEVPISPVVNSAPDTYYTDELGNILYDIPDPTPHIEESIIREEDLRTLVDSIHTISKDEADKDFITLFHLRYVKGLKQKEIAQELGISQGEVSKRILKMIQKLNASLDPNKD